MKSKKFIAALVILMSLLAACNKEENVTIPDIQLNPKQSNVITMGNDFGFRVFKEINKADQGKNIFISPLSISMALGMTLNGATGNTRIAMENTLLLNGFTPEEINTTYKATIDYLMAVDPNIVFNLANSIWYRDDFTVEQEFIKVNQEHFYAEINPLDFNNPSSANIINSWVSNKTHDKIKKIIDEISPDHVMFLINALYFKGNWKYRFNQVNTTNQLFYLEDGNTRETPTMVQKGTFNYFSNDQFSSVELPYGVGRYNMYVFLPNPGYSLENMVQLLTNQNWNQWLGNYAPTQDVEIHFPKFKLEYEKKLNDALTAMGMGVAFTDMAEFAGINPTAPLAISEVKHKTFVEVNEAGTEAAAVTSVGIVLTSVPEITYFQMDRPFLFVIAEKSSTGVLFIGKIVNPEL